MKTLVFSALIAIALSGCAAAVVPMAALTDGVVAEGRGEQTYIAKGIAWACDQVGGTYATDGSGDCNGPL